MTGSSVAGARAPRVLVLCYDFPPHTSAGAGRPWSWFLHFKKHGVEPVVVTRHWDEGVRGETDALKPSSCRRTTREEDARGTIVRTPFSPNARDRMLVRHGAERLRTPRRFLSLLHQLAQFVTFVGDARARIFRQADADLRSGGYDLILATGEPFVLFRYASILSRRHGVPWVADYRDLWRLNHMRAKSGALDRALLRWEGLFEKKYLANAAFAVTVTEELAAALSAHLGKTVHAVPNGAELELFEGAGPRFERFTLVYTGTMYDLPYAGVFAAGFRRFMAAHPGAAVDALFVGVEQRGNRAVEEIKRLAAEFPGAVKLVDRVSMREAAHLQARASVLLSFIAGAQVKGLIGAKTYAYAATGNPILVVPNEGGRETAFFPGRDVQRFALDADEVAAALADYHARFVRGEPLRTSITDEEVAALSREHQASRLAALIRREIGR